MEKITDYMIDKCLSHHLIEENEVEWCRYVWAVRIEQIITLVTIMIISIWLGVTYQTIFFLINFFWLRKHAGGYHANSFLKCFCSTIVVYVGFTMWIYPLFMQYQKIILITLAASVLIIAKIGAVNHPNIQWTETEYKESKQAVRLILIYEMVIVFALFALECEKSYIAFIVFGILLCAILMVMAEIFGQSLRLEKQS